MVRRARRAAPKRAKAKSRTSPAKHKVPTQKKARGKQAKRHQGESARAASARKGIAARTPAAVEQPFETVIVDTVEEPMPGVLIVTETEYAVERAGGDNPGRSRKASRRSRSDEP